MQTGDPCDLAQIAEIEPDVEELFDDELGCAVEELYGNVADGMADDHVSVDKYARYLMDTSDMPNWGYLIALGDGEIHTPILLNRDNPAYPQGALVCVDLEVEEETMIAESL